MTKQLLWKEAREQGAVLLALVGLGSGLMAATAILNGSAGAAEGLSFRTINYTGRILLVMLVMAAGTVVGGSLFAGEREQGTFTYLDHLPTSRWKVWWRKVLAGALLAAGASLLLLVAAGLADQLGGATPPILIGWALAVLVLAALGYGWGAFGSAQSESSLGACGLGLAGACASVLVSGLFFLILLNATGRWLPDLLGIGRHDEGTVVVLLVVWTTLAVPLPLAAVLYTAPDRSRRLAEQNAPPPQLDTGRPRAERPRTPRPPRFQQYRRMNWLLWRQLRVTLAVQAGLALLLGVVVVPWNENWPSSQLLPAVGLVLGVLAGVATLGDEQKSGAARFWAERRLPVGRLWRDKVLNGAGLVLMTTVLSLLPTVFVTLTSGRRSEHGPLATVFASGLFVQDFPVLTYLFLGPVYGFAFGHLAGLLFPKGTVAGAVGLLLGGTVGAAWGPSLLAGGVHGWMVFVPPLVALLTARWLAWPWATDRLGRRGPILRLAGGFVAALVCVAAGLAYRTFGEIEAVADADKHLKFRAALPTFDETQPGRDIRRALSRWQQDIPDAVRAEPVGRPLTGRPDPIQGRASRRFVEAIGDVLTDGWPAGRADADRWMDTAFAVDWDESVYQIVDKPLGVLEDPNEMYGLIRPLRYIQQFQEVTPVFLARGLQKQAQGDPADFVRRTEAWLAACRTAKRHTLPHIAMAAEACELRVYRGLDRWLERLDGHPELLKRALEVVQRHDAEDRPDPADVRLAEQVLFQNSVDAPGQWLPQWLEQMPLPPEGYRGRRVGMRAESEANAVAFAWTLPWEKERLRRAVAAGNDPARRAERAALLAGTPGLGEFAFYESLMERRGEPPYSPMPVAARRAALVSLALRLHHLAAGRYPDSLDALVPAYLSAVPTDPYDRQPLRYRRVTKPEVVMMPAYLVPPRKSALPPGGELAYRDYLAAAGLAGGLTGWPFQPGWFVLEDEDGSDLYRARWRPRWTEAGSDLPLAGEWRAALSGDGALAEVPLAVGRAVVWSVGKDKVDNGGKGMGDRDAAGSDWLFPVPDPPASPTQATPAPAR